MTFTVKILRKKNNDFPDYKISDTAENTGEKSTPQKQQSQNKEWKLQTQFYWLYMGDNEKCNMSNTR